MISKELTHDLDPDQVSQQWIDCDHLKQQQESSHKHQHVAAGEVIQKVLEERNHSVGLSHAAVTVAREGKWCHLVPSFKKTTTLYCISLYSYKHAIFQNLKKISCEIMDHNTFIYYYIYIYIIYIYMYLDFTFKGCVLWEFFFLTFKKKREKNTLNAKQLK